MSSVKITFIRQGGVGNDLRAMPIMDLSDPNLGTTPSQVITSSGTSQATSASSPHPNGEGFVLIQNNGTDVIAIKAGTAPTAVAATCPSVLANTEKICAVSQGHKIAVINA